MAITIYKGKEDKDESQKDHLSTIHFNFTKLGRKINTNYPNKAKKGLLCKDRDGFKPPLWELKANNAALT